LDFLIAQGEIFIGKPAPTSIFDLC